MFLGSILPAQARNIPEKKQILPGSSIIYNSLAPKHEVRAVWLTTIGGIDWPHSYSQSPYSAKKQQQELCQILDRLQQAKINTVLIQTRIRGTMIYPSDYEPWDGCLSGFPGKTPGYDPCRQMGSAGMQEPPEEIPGTHQKDRCRWIYESGRQPHRRLPCRNLPRDYSPI